MGSSLSEKAAHCVVGEPKDRVFSDSEQKSASLSMPPPDPGVPPGTSWSLAVGLPGCSPEAMPSTPTSWTSDQQV